VEPDESARAGGRWAGAANALSPQHVRWRVIEQAAEAAGKPRTEARSFLPGTLPPLPPAPPVPAATLIRQRRSCLGLDGRTGIEARALYGMLDHLLRRPGVPPWDVLPWGPRLHLGLFVHRVVGLLPGLYLFERDPADHEALKGALAGSFAWERPGGCPGHLRL